MIDIQKQVAYWQNGAIEEWDLAQGLIKRNKTRHGLFFAHPGRALSRFVNGSSFQKRGEKLFAPSRGGLSMVDESIVNIVR
jgi:hypothetical protein